MSDVDPIVGNWYCNRDNDSEFEVVAVDEDAQTIEIQYFDGDVDELDLDAWYDLPIEAIAPPEDWQGAFDSIEEGELGYEEEERETEDDISDEDDLLNERDD